MRTNNASLRSHSLGGSIVACVTALGLVSSPVLAAPAPAEPPPTDVAAPDPAAPTEPPPGDVAAPTEPAPTDPAAPTDPTAPTDPALEPPPPEPEPVAEPEPEPEPPPPVVEPPPPEPAPVEPVAPIDRGQKLRLAGIVTMATGGALALIGFGLTLGFTVRDNALRDDLRGVEDDLFQGNCNVASGGQCADLRAQRDGIEDDLDRANLMTQVGGGMLAGGLLTTLAGGIVYRIGVKRRGDENQTARVKVRPTLGGAVIHGRF